MKERNLGRCMIQSPSSFQCFDHKINQPVAIKIIRNKKRFHHQALVEVKILDSLRKKVSQLVSLYLQYMKPCLSYLFAGPRQPVQYHSHDRLFLLSESSLHYI